MGTYVDDMAAVHRPKHAPGRKYVLCHMIADSAEELHQMATLIGVDRKWYQGDHYDIAITKKKLAIKNGAREITRRELGAMAMLMRCGQPMGSPETAIARMHEYFKLVPIMNPSEKEDA